MPDYIQLKMDERILKLCKERSKEIPGCPRPKHGSAAHFIKSAVYDKLRKRVSDPVYLNEIFGK